MKRNLYLVNPSPKYPNQASREYYTQKLLDGVTSVIAGAGFVTFFFFLMTM